MSKKKNKPVPSTTAAPTANEPQLRGPVATFRAPHCGWCRSRMLCYAQSKEKIEVHRVIDPAGVPRAVRVKGMVKYCKCKRCPYTCNRFFKSETLLD